MTTCSSCAWLTCVLRKLNFHVHRGDRLHWVTPGINSLEAAHPHLPLPQSCACEVTKNVLEASVELNSTNSEDGIFFKRSCSNVMITWPMFCCHPKYNNTQMCPLPIMWMVQKSGRFIRKLKSSVSTGHCKQRAKYAVFWGAEEFVGCLIIPGRCTRVLGEK